MCSSLVEGERGRNRSQRNRGAVRVREQMRGATFRSVRSVCLTHLAASRHFSTLSCVLLCCCSATGTGVALDAISRGLKVALVERDDFASGTNCAAAPSDVVDVAAASGSQPLPLPLLAVTHWMHATRAQRAEASTHSRFVCLQRYALRRLMQARAAAAPS